MNETINLILLVVLVLMIFACFVLLEIAESKTSKWIPEHICPTCKGVLKRVYPNPEYWMCYKCIKGYNNEELKGEMKDEI